MMLSSDSLAGRTAIVTGGGRGIGRAIASELASFGARVAVFEIDKTAITDFSAFAAECGLDMTPIQCDITKPEDVEKAVGEARDKYGPVSILVNNAGVIDFKSLGDTSVQDLHRTFSINVYGAFYCTNAVVADMKEQNWGKIVMVGSSAGKTGGANNSSVYGASKAALMVLAKSFARELAPYSINVNAVAPALINTQMLDGINDFTSMIPLGRVGEPEDVANLVSYLCTDAASFITGEVVDINGGFLID